MLTTGILFALGGCGAWGLTQILMKKGLQGTDWVSFAFTRATLAVLFVIPYVIVRGDVRWPGIALVGIAVLGGALDMVLGVMFYLGAIHWTSVHQAASLGNTAPLWGVCGAILFLGEAPGWGVFLAVFLVILGAYFLVERTNRRERMRSVLGPVLALGAGLFWGLGENIPSKYCLTNGVSATTYQLIIIITAAFCWGLIGLIRSRFFSPLRLSKKGIQISILAAFTGAFLGWILWLSALALAPASVIAPTRGSITLFAFLFSIVLLRERPTARSAAGGLLVVAGILVVSIAT